MYTEEVQRFRNAIDNVVDDVDKIYLRELQADSHACAAVCCRDKESPTKSLLECVENCGQKLQNAQRIVLKEFDRLEDRFERCLQSCSEYAREEDSREEQRTVYEGCVRRCVDSNLDIIPDLLKSIKEAFKNS